MAAAADARLAHPQHRQLLRPRARLHDRRPDVEQSDHDVRSRHRPGRGRGDQPGAEPRRDLGHTAHKPVPVLGHARRADPAAVRTPLSGAADIWAAADIGRETADGRPGAAVAAAARATFPDWRFAPNIGGHPDVYEIENRALDPDGYVLAAMRNLAPWDDRTVVDLGCGTGFWLAGYARDAARVIGIEPDPALRARAEARIRGVAGAEVLAGSAEHLPLAERSVDVVHARFAYFLSPGIVGGARAAHSADGARAAGAPGDAGLAEVMRVLRPGGSLIVVDNDYRWGEFAGLLAVAASVSPLHTASAI